MIITWKTGARQQPPGPAQTYLRAVQSNGRVLGYLIAFINESLEAAEEGLVRPYSHHHVGHRIQVSSKQLSKKLG